ncbi:MAG TPA: helix-turn-helix domain-containing protein [Dehalococcoidia bacterium]|nr:helix-turn-helix domain-containing protein [Dehalococcoidia bacterium]
MQALRLLAHDRLPSIDERCARRLLMRHDRFNRAGFPLTQGFLAQMQGVRRTSVNAAAGVLQRAGFIRRSRGVIAIVDRAGTDSASRQRYGTIRGELDRLLGPA